jgi:hypothetical protein
MLSMNKPWKTLPRIGAAVALMVVGFLAFRAYGWPGLALAGGGVVMWVLLSMTRMLKVLQRTGEHPVGTVASAVMLHSRLSPGMTLLQVLALTRALGQRVGELQAPVEQYQWTDSADAAVHCTFANGKLVEWVLVRP